MDPTNNSLNSTAASPFVAQAQTDAYPIIVHSHLGWDWVWQRPQQFLSRLSRKHRVLFIEGPVPSEIFGCAVSLREVSDYPNIIVLQMQLPAARWSDGAWVDQERRRQVDLFSPARLAAFSPLRCNGSMIRWP